MRPIFLTLSYFHIWIKYISHSTRQNTAIQRIIILNSINEINKLFNEIVSWSYQIGEVNEILSVYMKIHDFTLICYLGNIWSKRY